MHSASKRRGGSVSGSGGVHSTAAGSSTDDDKLLTGEECFDNRAWRASITGSGQASSSEGPLTQQQEPQSQQQSQSATGHWTYDAGQNWTATATAVEPAKKRRVDSGTSTAAGISTDGGSQHSIATTILDPHAITTPFESI
jgi:hypothetical protein